MGKGRAKLNETRELRILKAIWADTKLHSYWETLRKLLPYVREPMVDFGLGNWVKMKKVMVGTPGFENNGEVEKFKKILDVLTVKIQEIYGKFHNGLWLQELICMSLLHPKLFNQESPRITQPHISWEFLDIDNVPIAVNITLGAGVRRSEVTKFIRENWKQFKIINYSLNPTDLANQRFRIRTKTERDIEIKALRKKGYSAKRISGLLIDSGHQKASLAAIYKVSKK